MAAAHTLSSASDELLISSRIATCTVEAAVSRQLAQQGKKVQGERNAQGSSYRSTFQHIPSIPYSFSRCRPAEVLLATLQT